jgi:hypothetical protein
MPRVGLEPLTPVFERAKKSRALDRLATVICKLLNNETNSTVMIEEHYKFSPESRVTKQKTIYLGMNNTACSCS